MDKVYYRCDQCKHIFAEDEIATTEEVFENGFTRYLDVCPACGCEDMREGLKCAKCGRFFEHDSMYESTPLFGLCDACISKHITVEACKKVGDKHLRTVAINSFLAYVFDAAEIEDILVRELQDILLTTYDCADYLQEMDDHCNVRGEVTENEENS